MINENLYLGDCIEKMSVIENNTIDMIFVDPPYGSTVCKWDIIIPFDDMWKQIKRVICPNGIICIMGSQPFTSLLINSNLDWFKYCWVWDKVNKATGHLNAKKQPMRITEDICVFYNKPGKYFPIMVEREAPVRASNGSKKKNTESKIYGEQVHIQPKEYTHKYPNNIISIKSEDSRSTIHPSQKPVALIEYLIKTYTNENDAVLDFCMGSGSTGIACMNLNRNFIGIEKDEGYYNIAKERLCQHEAMLDMERK